MRSPRFRRYVLHVEDEQVLALAGVPDFRAEFAGQARGGRPAIIAQARDLLRHDGVAEIRRERAVAAAGVGPEILRQLRQVLLERHRVNRVLEGKGGHAHDEVHRDIVQVGQLVEQRGLEFHDGVARAVQFDFVARNPPHALLQIEQADVGGLRRFGPAPVELQVQQVAELLAGGGRLMRMLEGDFLNAIKRERLHPFGGLEQDQVPLLGKSLAGVWRTGRRLFFRAARRQAEDCGGITVCAGFGDDGLGANVGFEQLAQVQRGALDQHALLAGDHARKSGALLRRIGPKGADHGRRQVVHHDVAAIISRHLTFVRDKGMAVLEHGEFFDGQFAERAQGRGFSAARAGMDNTCARTSAGARQRLNSAIFMRGS